MNKLLVHFILYTGAADHSKNQHHEVSSKVITIVINLSVPHGLCAVVYIQRSNDIADWRNCSRGICILYQSKTSTGN